MSGFKDKFKADEKAFVFDIHKQHLSTLKLSEKDGFASLAIPGRVWIKSSRYCEGGTTKAIFQKAIKIVIAICMFEKDGFASLAMTGRESVMAINHSYL